MQFEAAAGPDALLMDVPVVSVDLAGELREIDFVAAGASLHVTQEVDLGPAVTRAIGSWRKLPELRKNVDAFLQSAFHELNSDPARVAAETILRLRSERVAAV